ncbi:MAG: hypothetical protein PHS44_02460 [Candidatus Dojkabacteria bacterium]|nr:hypothetical protein [Candidatus Dojkabacteria bacterium]
MKKIGLAALIGILMLITGIPSTISVKASDTEFEKEFEETKKIVQEGNESLQDKIDKTEKEYEDAKKTQEEQEDEVEDQAKEPQEYISEVRDMQKDFLESDFSPVKMLEKIQETAKVFGRMLGGFVIVVILIQIAQTVFGIAMIADCAKSDNKDKGLWLAILITTNLLMIGFLPSLLYLFLVKKK